MKTPLGWCICDTCLFSDTYFTPASDIYDVCGDVYVQYMALMFDIYTYDMTLIISYWSRPLDGCSTTQRIVDLMEGSHDYVVLNIEWKHKAIR